MRKRRIERRRREKGGPVEKPWFRHLLSEHFARQKSAIRVTMKSETGVIDGVMMDMALDRQRRDLSDIGEMKPVL